MLNQELLKKIVKMLALGTSLSSLAIVKTDKCKRCGKEAGKASVCQQYINDAKASSEVKEQVRRILVDKKR